MLLVAKNDAAHRRLAAQFSGRQVEKVYLALVARANQAGERAHRAAHRPRPGASHAHDGPAGRGARGVVRIPRAAAASRASRLLEVRIGTGRTHQIRAHLASIGHPIAGDTVYGAPARAPGMPPLGRYFLHAHRIRFRQPSTGAEIVVESPLPAELGRVDEWACERTV